MNKKSIIIIVVILAVLAFWWWLRQTVKTPSNVNDIEKELEGVSPNDLDKEFQQIDKELDAF